MIEDRPHETQKRPYNRVTEAMAEIASQINQEKALLSCLEREYSFLSMMSHQITPREQLTYLPIEPV